MDGKVKQCVCIKFCVKVGKSATETLEMLREAFGEHSLSRTAVFEWHSRSGRPSTNETTENVKKNSTRLSLNDP
jgi:hypothetical protein